MSTAHTRKPRGRKPTPNTKAQIRKWLAVNAGKSPKPIKSISTD